MRSPSSDLPRFYDRAVSSRDHGRTSKGARRGDPEPSDSDGDDWPSDHRGCPGGRGDRGCPSDHGDRGDRGDRAERGDCGDRADRGDRAECGDHSDRADRRDHADRDDRGNRRQRRDREGPGDHRDRGDSRDASHGESGSYDRAGSPPFKRRSSKDDDSPTSRPVNGGGDPAVIRPAVTIGVAAATPTTAETTSTMQKSCGGVKLEPYDGTSCLETFLASVKNFATYYNWMDRDELFHLKASLRVRQVKHFGTWEQTSNWRS